MFSTPTDPLPLNHSWPLFDAGERLDISSHGPFRLGGYPSPHAIPSIDDNALAQRGIGVWECDLRDNRLSWSSSVYDLFGIPRGMEVDRGYTVSFYTPESRATMEYLRAYAIRHKRGFTVDAELSLPGGDNRWMRLSAVPRLEDGRVVRLCGLKIDATWEYDGGIPLARAT